MTRALITGITGMVGSHLADYLLANTRWDIYGMCRWRSPLDNVRHLMARAEKKDRLRFIYGDLKDSFSLQRAVWEARPDYVFHLAAQSYPRVSFYAPIDTLDTNILGTARLLEVIRACKLDPVIHVCASSEVYGRVSADKLPINEDCPFHGASPYAISKIGTDHLGRYYAEAYGMKIMTTRMFTHTGPRRGDVFVEASFAKQLALIEAGLIEPQIKVGNLKSRRTWSDVRDAVRAYYLLVTVNPRPGEAYNIGGEYSCTVGEMLNFLISIAAYPGHIDIVEDPERLRPLDADLQVPDTGKFTAHTGWRPEIAFEQTMADLLTYWREKISREGMVLTR
jgi:GDPmannose 4,6-dehydratase